MRVTLAVLSLLLVSAVVAARSGYVSALARAYPDIDAIARAAGFGIDQVSLTGYKYAVDRDVFDALDLANVRSLASLDADAVKDRLERVPWIQTAEITRVYPNRLEVRVTERKPFAIWLRGGRQYLIDDTGRVLTAVGGGSLPDHLPRVSGEGAAAAAPALLALVARYPAIARRFSEAERVGERRWTLKLAGGAILHLPADGEAQVLEAIARDPKLERLISAQNSSIDFRAPGRVSVRGLDDRAGTGATGS